MQLGLLDPKDKYSLTKPFEDDLVKQSLMGSIRASLQLAGSPELIMPLKIMVRPVICRPEALIHPNREFKNNPCFQTIINLFWLSIQKYQKH
jgi:hypothetical protein